MRYLATLIGTTDETAVRWFILVVAMLLDPGAVLLLLAATQGAPLMSKEPRVNMDRLVSNIMLDCSLMRRFAYNGRREDVLAVIFIQRTRARDTEGQVLDFLVRHCGGQQ